MSEGRGSDALRRLDAARWRMALRLTGAVVLLYFGFIALVAYGRHILAIQVIPGLSLGILLGALVPFTLIVILPTNKQLLNPTLDPSSKQARALLVRWGRLHAIRSVLSTAAFVLFILRLARS